MSPHVRMGRHSKDVFYQNRSNNANQIYIFHRLLHEKYKKMTVSLESLIKSLFTYKISDADAALPSYRQAHTASIKCIGQILLFFKLIPIHGSGVFVMQWLSA